MGDEMGLSETIIIMLVYGGLFIYTLQLTSSNNKIIIYIKSAFLITLYVFISTIIWFTYKGEEYHINNHSGYDPISFTGEAILLIIGLSIYSVILILLSNLLKKRVINKPPKF